MDFGFIITRHVNSEKTNKYWNQSIKLLRNLYPAKKIVVIDDNSDQSLVKAEFDYSNVEYIQSEYPGRGELLPFIYYLKHKWFENAVIMHDSIFIHKRFPFENIKVPIVPLWHFDYDKENIQNISRISSGLNRQYKLHTMINGTSEIAFLAINKPDIVCCFGAMCFIKHSFLQKIEVDFKLSNLVNYIHNRTDRCSLERIIGILFTIQYPSIKNYKSLFGNIQKQGMWGYTYDQYETAFFKYGKVPRQIVKVWTGR